MARRQTERNDGGLYRSLVDLTWADGWLEQADMTRSTITADSTTHEDWIEAAVHRIDRAEVSFWSCGPTARAVVEREHMADCDWDEAPSWYEQHAEMAATAEGLK